MKKLQIFVSSTCYDLSQIRKDLRSYLDNCGYTPILSEFNDFPVNPQKRTLDNCVEAVKSDADIFILIVGNRYGNIIENRSITNMEYLTALDKGIPIYVFIDASMLSILPVWMQNKSGDFSNVVDTTKIFEFISDIRDSERLWTFEYKSAQDIISVLKTQLSYLFKESLIISSKINNNTHPQYKNELSNEALYLMLTKPKYYESKFFLQTLKDEILKKENMMNNLKYSIYLKPQIAVWDNLNFLNWMRQNMSLLKDYMESLVRLISDALPFYFAESGVPSDLKGLFYVSRTYSSIFESLINWSIDNASTCVNEGSIPLRDSFSKLANKILNQVWNYPFLAYDSHQKAIEENRPLELLPLLIRFDDEDYDNYNREFQLFQEKYLDVN